MSLDKIQQDLLEKVTDLHEIPAGAYNIRANGTSAGRNTTANIDIVTKKDKNGIDIIWSLSIFAVPITMLWYCCGKIFESSAKYLPPFIGS